LHFFSFAEPVIMHNVWKRYSAPTAPKVTREMKPPSNRANQFRQKARTWRGAE
jgi:hypothetical protein